jgi:hypothetical protein
MLRYAMLCYAMLFYATICYATICDATMWEDVIRYEDKDEKENEVFLMMTRDDAADIWEDGRKMPCLIVVFVDNFLALMVKVWKGKRLLANGEEVDIYDDMSEGD